MMDEQMPLAEVDASHRSVMLNEVVASLAPHAEGLYLDVTAGRGGHAEGILRASSPTGRIIALDRDPEAVQACQARLAAYGSRATVVQSRFSAMSSVLCELGFSQQRWTGDVSERAGVPAEERALGYRLPRAARKQSSSVEDESNQHKARQVDAGIEAGIDHTGPLHGMLADFGVSSPQLDVASRGFSFRLSGPIDMRMDNSEGPTAYEWMRAVDEAELADALFFWGGERRSRRVARRIKQALEEGMPNDTVALADVIAKAVGGPRQRIHPATRSFQGIRIAVNRELDEITAWLSAAPQWLRPGGIFAAISFHSLEDRLVKWALREDPRWEVITKRPICPSEEELEVNPRARSAKLRVARRVPLPGFAPHLADSSNVAAGDAGVGCSPSTSHGARSECDVTNGAQPVSRPFVERLSASAMQRRTQPLRHATGVTLWTIPSPSVRP